MPQWTKLDVIRQAFAEVGLASQDFDLAPEDLQSALRQLDAMLATWGGALGVRISYSGGDGKGDISASSEVPDWAYEALYLNLAMRIASSFGRSPMPGTILNAKLALDAVRTRTVQIAPRVLSGYAGAGNTYYGVTALPEDPVEPITTGSDNTLPFG